MKAIILAAGRGSRLGEMGNDRPKCLVEFAGRPLIEHQLAALRRAGVDQIALVRGYRAEMLQIPATASFDNVRWAETNMVVSLSCADSWLQEETVIVSYGDIFYGSSVIEKLIESPGDLVISYDRNWRSLWSRRFVDPLTDAETFRVDEAGILIEIGGKTDNYASIEGQYMGLLKFTPTSWRWVRDTLSQLPVSVVDRLDMTGLLRRLLEKKKVISTVSTVEHWGEIDDAGDLALYERMHETGELVLE